MFYDVFAHVHIVALHPKSLPLLHILPSFLFQVLQFVSVVVCFVLSQTFRFSGQRSSILLHKLYEGFGVLVGFFMRQCKLFLGHFVYYFVMEYFPHLTWCGFELHHVESFFGILHTRMFPQLFR